MWMIILSLIKTKSIVWRAIVCTGIVLPLTISVAHSDEKNVSLAHPLYAGVSAGLGSTTWDGLVPSDANQNMAVSISTPTEVSEGGGVWGVFAGYEFGSYFALEANYMRFPNATIFFDENSLYAFENNGLLKLKTNTETISLMGKVMLTIPRTRLRFYSSAGVAEVHRWDNMNDDRRSTPTFGVGFNYNISDHIMTELGVNYTAGYGESELNPAKDYVPFLYAGFLRLAYRV